MTSLPCASSRLAWASVSKADSVPSRDIRSAMRGPLTRSPVGREGRPGAAAPPRRRSPLAPNGGPHGVIESKVHLGTRPLEHALDGPVGPVGHGAADPELGGPEEDEGAEADVLDAPAHRRMDAQLIRHRPIIQDAAPAKPAGAGSREAASAGTWEPRPAAGRDRRARRVRRLRLPLSPRPPGCG